MIDETDNSHISFNSSLDSADLYEEYRELIGNDQICTLVICYLNLQPASVEGLGTKITFVHSCGGSECHIPEALWRPMIL